MAGDLGTPLIRYGVCIAALATYALLPMSLLPYVYALHRILLLIFITHVLLPNNFEPELRYAQPIMKPLNGFRELTGSTIDLLLSFQRLLAQVKDFLVSEKYQYAGIAIATLFMVLPTKLLFLTQYLAVYIISLFSYQFSSLYCKEGNKWLQKSENEQFKPSVDQAKLSELQIVQMKLVTMFLINVVTFMPVTYLQVVLLFVIVPMIIPPLAMCSKQLFNNVYQNIVKLSMNDTVQKKMIDGILCLITLFSLLVNYKYETHILNFLLAMYSSILLGQLGSVFYCGHQNSPVTSGDDIIDTLYNAETVLSFWAVCLLYEVTSLIEIPRLVFIALSIMIGVDIDIPFNISVALYTRLYKPTTVFKNTVQSCSQWAVAAPISCFWRHSDNEDKECGLGPAVL